uniref:Reverse transcriptase domain-containing protein n=1 Tax=Chara braunii TaxID=69332 RepID=A0A388K617_CHABU
MVHDPCRLLLMKENCLAGDGCIWKHDRTILRQGWCRTGELVKMLPEIQGVVAKYPDLFEELTGVVEKEVVHAIEIIPGSGIPKGRIYRMSPGELDELRRQLKELVEKGWIRPIVPPYGSPVLFVPKKKEGTLRMCIDYMGLNAIIVKNREPLPRIDDLLDRVQGCRYFSKIDLKSGYHQIAIQPEDQHKTAFQTRYGLYEFVVMPFGLCNAPDTFQHAMNRIFHDYMDKFEIVYLDDILIFSKTVEEHVAHLDKVPSLLRQHKFKINGEKCEFGRTRVLYLGHEISAEGLKPDDAKVASIRDWPRPQSVTEMRSFLGITGYYRNFVKNYSIVVAPLTDLTHLDTPWEWTDRCEAAFRHLKHALTHHEVLKLPDPNKPFIVTMDASQFGIGAVLAQQEGKKLRPVEYTSKKMPSQKLAKSTYEKELYAIYKAHPLEALPPWEIVSNTTAIETMTRLVVIEEVARGEERKEPKEKFMKDAIKSTRVTPEKPRSSKKEHKKPAEKKVEPTKEPAKEVEKLKRKEKVKIKLPFTYNGKRGEHLLLWIAKIQTYCGTAPVEPESQVAFTTACLCETAKEWVLSEANAAGFEDIGEWAKTLTLREFLQKIEERFLDKTATNKAFDELTTIGQKRWTSAGTLSHEVDRLLQVPGLNLQDNQVLYIFSRALHEPIRGHLVAEAKSGKYNYRQRHDLALQREQMTTHVKGTYASVVKFGTVGGYGKRVLWRQKRQDHMLVVFDDDTVEKLPHDESEGGEQQPQVEVVMKVEGEQPSASTPPSPPLTATQRLKELEEQLRQQQARLAEVEQQEAAELEAATDHSRREYLLQQLERSLADDRCSQVTKHMAAMILLEHKITNSQFTNWDDRFVRLERRVDELSAQQTKILKSIQGLTAQLAAAKLTTPQTPLLQPKSSPHSSPPSSPHPSHAGSVHSSRSSTPSQKASAKATYAVVTAGDQRGPKITAPNKFRGDPKTDVGDWAAGTRAYLRGFACAEQTNVATVLGLLEGPALKWATSTSSSLQQSMEDWAFGLGVDRLLQALEERFADKERARKAAGRIARLGQQRYSGTLQALFLEFEQLTSTPELVMSPDDLLTNFFRAAPEKFVVALYNAGHKDWRSFGRAALEMEAKLHVQAPSSDRRKGAFPRGGRKGKATFTHAGSASGSDSDSQADTPSAGTRSAAETDVAAAVTQAVLGALQLQKSFLRPQPQPVPRGRKRDTNAPSVSYPPEIQQVVDQYADLMQEPFGLPNWPTKHHIELLPGAVPPKGRIYRMSSVELEELRKQLEELRKQLETLTSKDWIRPSTSEFGALVLFVPKGNGEFKMCIDYMGLNKITRKSTEPLPRIDHLVDMVQGCTVFSKVNLKSGYHQIEMAEGDVYKTAFKTGHFKIFSDHSTLQWMKSQGELNNKLVQYIQFIDMFDFELKHKKGCDNKVADALSRRPDSFALISSTHSFGEETRQTIAHLLPQDETFGPIVRNLQANPNSEPGYVLSSDLLYTCSRGEERLCIPQDQRLKTLLMSECHDARGHFGFLKSYAALSQRFFWKEMRSEMLRYVDTCELCQRNKVHRRPHLGLLKPLPIPDGPAESLSIDFTDLGKTTPRGMRQVMVCVEVLLHEVLQESMPPDLRVLLFQGRNLANFLRDFQDFCLIKKWNRKAILYMFPLFVCEGLSEEVYALKQKAKTWDELESSLRLKFPEYGIEGQCGECSVKPVVGAPSQAELSGLQRQVGALEERLARLEEAKRGKRKVSEDSPSELDDQRERGVEEDDQESPLSIGAPKRRVGAQAKNKGEGFVEIKEEQDANMALPVIAPDPKRRLTNRETSSAAGQERQKNGWWPEHWVKGVFDCWGNTGRTPQGSEEKGVTGEKGELEPSKLTKAQQGTSLRAVKVPKKGRARGRWQLPRESWKDDLDGGDDGDSVNAVGLGTRGGASGSRGTAWSRVHGESQLWRQVSPLHRRDSHRSLLSFLSMDPPSVRHSDDGWEDSLVVMTLLVVQILQERNVAAMMVLQAAAALPLSIPGVGDNIALIAGGLLHNHIMQCAALKTLHRTAERRRALWVLERNGGVWSDLQKEGEQYDRVSRRLCRLPPAMFLEVLDRIGPHIQRQDTNWRRSLPAALKFACALGRWAMGTYYRQYGHSLGVGLASAQRSNIDVAEALIKEYGHVIAWPEGRRLQETLDAFERKGFPGCVGVIDCTHRYIEKPKGARVECFYDRTGGHSIVAQVCCDHEGRILNVFVGCPGAVHDARVLRLSPMYNNVQEGRVIFHSGACTLRDGGEVGYYLLGDAGYPLLPWIMTLVGGSERTTLQRQYDDFHTAARSIIERCFGRLKGVWRNFIKRHICNLKTLTKEFMAVCILHNLMIDAHVVIYRSLLTAESDSEEENDGVGRPRRQWRRRRINRRDEVHNREEGWGWDDASLAHSTDASKAIRDRLIAHVHHHARVRGAPPSNPWGV